MWKYLKSGQGCCCWSRRTGRRRCNRRRWRISRRRCCCGRRGIGGCWCGCGSASRRIGRRWARCFRWCQCGRGCAGGCRCRGRGWGGSWRTGWNFTQVPHDQGKIHKVRLLGAARNAGGRRSEGQNSNYRKGENSWGFHGITFPNRLVLGSVTRLHSALAKSRLIVQYVHNSVKAEGKAQWLPNEELRQKNDMPMPRYSCGRCRRRGRWRRRRGIAWRRRWCERGHAGGRWRGR